MSLQHIPGWVNPLTFLEADEAWSTINKTSPSWESILGFLCPPDEPSTGVEMRPVSTGRSDDLELAKRVLAALGGVASGLFVDDVDDAEVSRVSDAVAYLTAYGSVVEKR